MLLQVQVLATQEQGKVIATINTSVKSIERGAKHSDSLVADVLRESNAS